MSLTTGLVSGITVSCWSDSAGNIAGRKQKQGAKLVDEPAGLCGGAVPDMMLVLAWLHTNQGSLLAVSAVGKRKEKKKKRNGRKT